MLNALNIYINNIYLLMMNLPYKLFKYINEKLIDFSLSDLQNFIFMNKYTLIFLFLVYLGIIFNNRFPLKNKIYILLYYLFMITFFMLFKNIDSIFIKEIF